MPFNGTPQRNPTAASELKTPDASAHTKNLFLSALNGAKIPPSK
jgi:hypothetical protein